MVEEQLKLTQLIDQEEGGQIGRPREMAERLDKDLNGSIKLLKGLYFHLNPSLHLLMV